MVQRRWVHHDAHPEPAPAPLAADVQQPGNRLRVFRIANTVSLGRGVGQERWLRMRLSENYVAL